MSCYVETSNLRWSEITGNVALLLREDEISLGHIDCGAEEECPTLLREELEELRARVFEQRYGTVPAILPYHSAIPMEEA